jgi:hypothetical protein
MSKMFIEKLKAFLEENKPEDGTQVMIAAFQCDSGGRPMGTITTSNAGMMATIGMVEYLHDRLEDIRKEIYEEIEKHSSKNVAVDDIIKDRHDDLKEYFDALPLHMVPDEVANLIRTYDEKIRENLIKGNIPEFERLKMELLKKLQDYRRASRKDDSGGSDQDIDKFGDFKDTF